MGWAGCAAGGGWTTRGGVPALARRGVDRRGVAYLGRVTLSRRRPPYRDCCWGQGTQRGGVGKEGEDRSTWQVQGTADKTVRRGRDMVRPVIVLDRILCRSELNAFSRNPVLKPVVQQILDLRVPHSSAAASRWLEDYGTETNLWLYVLATDNNTM